MTKDQKNIVFFCENEDWIIPRSDPLAEKMIQMVQSIQNKTKMHAHKGTYRLRAWLVPENKSAKGLKRPFGRQEA